MSRNFNQKAIKYEFQSNNDKKIHFCFKYGFAFYCIKTKVFTNYFENEKSYIKFTGKLFTNAIPELSTKTFDEIKKEKRHYHKIDSSKVNDVKEILKEILKKKNPEMSPNQIQNYLKQNFLDTDIYQIGTTNGLRIVGVLSGDIFEILFFDTYHLIYSSQQHNQNNYFSYNYSPLEKE